MLYAYNQLVDLVQNAKTDFIKSYITNEEFSKPAQTYVDAQTKFAKAVGQNVWDFASVMGTSMYNFNPANAFTKPAKASAK